MNNVKITRTMLSNNELLPNEIRPKRFAIASNFIACFEKHSGERYFLLFNYEPQKWNQWYPYFYSTSGSFECQATTYAELMAEYQGLPSQYPQINMRLDKALESISGILGIHDEISVKGSSIETEYWIKYSKTQDVWTFYEIEFLQIVQLPEIDFSKLGDVDLLPLEESAISDVLSTGNFKNIPVVDNTLDILGNTEQLMQLIEKSIII